MPTEWDGYEFTVLRWPRLSKGAVVLLLELYRRLGGVGAGPVDVAFVMGDLGLSASTYGRLERELRRRGLIIVGRAVGGRKLLEISNPNNVPRDEGLPRAAAGPTQLRLFETGEGESAEIDTHKRGQKWVSNVTQNQRTGCSKATASGPEPPTTHQVAATEASGQTPQPSRPPPADLRSRDPKDQEDLEVDDVDFEEEDRARIRDTARLVISIVGDDRLYWSVAETIARELVRTAKLEELECRAVRPVQRQTLAGKPRLERADLDRALTNAHRAYRRNRTPSVRQYFIGAIRRKLREIGRPWPHGSRRPSTVAEG